MMVETEKHTRSVLVCAKLDEFVSKDSLFLAHVITYAGCHVRIRKVRIFNNSTDVLSKSKNFI